MNEMKQSCYSLGQPALLGYRNSFPALLNVICDGICVGYASASSQSFQYGKINDVQLYVLYKGIVNSFGEFELR